MLTKNFFHFSGTLEDSHNQLLIFISAVISGSQDIPAGLILFNGLSGVVAGGGRVALRISHNRSGRVHSIAANEKIFRQLLLEDFDVSFEGRKGFLSQLDAG